MLLNKPVSFRKSDSKKFMNAKPTKLFYEGCEKASKAVQNSKHLNFDWVKRYFRNE